MHFHGPSEGLRVLKPIRLSLPSVCFRWRFAGSTRRAAVAGSSGRSFTQNPTPRLALPGFSSTPSRNCITAPQISTSSYKPACGELNRSAKQRQGIPSSWRKGNAGNGCGCILVAWASCPCKCSIPPLAGLTTGETPVPRLVTSTTLTSLGSASLPPIRSHTPGNPRLGQSGFRMIEY
jgi:hypothetical protein